MTCNVTPQISFLESSDDNIGSWYANLRIEDLSEAPNEINIIIWLANIWVISELWSAIC